MSVTPHQRLSEEVLASAIVKFYEANKLIPLGVSVQALEGWSAKMAVGLRKTVSKFRKLFAEAPAGSKNKDVAELKARLVKANVKPPAPEDLERGSSHEDLQELSTAAPAAGPAVKELEVKPPVRPQATPARSERLPGYLLESLKGAVLPPAPFVTQGGEEEVAEGQAEKAEKKTKAEKKKAPKGKKAKKSKKAKKEIAGPEEEENLAIPAVAPVSEKPAPKVSYSPGLYKAARLAFVRKQKKELGMNRDEAEDAWKASEERANLLADLSYSELKRRRFIWEPAPNG
eukprot:Skav225516  [mRNA]  locus=scaffold1721:469933:470793:- [translate_table: standard]